MKVVPYGKSKLVFGVQWTTLPGAGAQIDEIRSTAKDNQAKAYVTIAREGSLPLVGLAATPEGRGQKRAAAALILLLCPDVKNAVFAFQFKDGSAAAICFRDGLPMVGYDFCGSPSTVSRRIEQFVTAMGDLSETIVFAGEEKLFYDCPYLAEIHPFDFEEQDLERKEFKNTIFQRVFIPTIAIALLTIVLIGSIAGYYTYDYYRQEEIKKLQSKKIDPNAAYEASVTKALQDTGPSAQKTASIIHPHISNLPLFFGGWNLETVICQIDNCSMTWVPDTYLASTFDDFKDSLPEKWSAAYRSDFQTIVTSMQINAEVKKGMNRSFLPNTNDFIVRMGSEVQRLKFIGVEFRIEPAVLFAVPPLPADNPPITEAVLKNPVKEGNWRVSGGWIGMDFLQTLPPSMTINSATMTSRGQDISIQVEGKYYVTR